MSYRIPRLVAAWYFEVDPSVPVGSSPIEWLASVAHRCLEVLQVVRILIPRELVMDGWVEEADGRASPAKVAKVNLPIQPTTGAGALVATVREYAIANERPSAVPRLSFTGDTEVVTPTGPVIEAGLMKLDVIYEGGGVTVVLSTYSVIWLPYDLKAEPQFGIGRRNGPRLDEALRALSTTLAAPTTPSAQTRYAIATTTGLQNARRSNGTIAAVNFE